MGFTSVWLHGNGIGILSTSKQVYLMNYDRRFKKSVAFRPSALMVSSKLLLSSSDDQSREKNTSNPLQIVASAAFDGIENLISAMEKNNPLHKNFDPQFQLQGNFYPVPEMPVVHNLQIDGQIPTALDGCMYVRNGANPRFKPNGRHHLFDGDGMIHALQFKQGMANYCCRFTRTNRMITEERIGKPYYPKTIGELRGYCGIAKLMLYYARGMFGLVDVGKGMGTANAGLIFFNGRLLAMSEDDLPYSVNVTQDGDLQTQGRFDFNGQLHSSMTAHPKIDPHTGEFFGIRYDVLRPPYLTYFMFNPDGSKGNEVPIRLQKPTMIHDFAITKNYIVLPDHQIVFNLGNMVSGGSPVVFDSHKVCRFGILPKYDGNDNRMQWIEVAGCFCYHLWNAWEESDEEIIVIGSHMSPPDSIFHVSDQLLSSTLTEIRLNMKTNSSTRRQISPLTLEAGHVNRNYIGRKCRYVYLAIAEPWPKVSGIAKIDLQSKGTNPLEDNVVAKIAYDQGCYGGEPFYVPRTSCPFAAEDDGYLLTFMYDENTGRSVLLVLDAASESLEPVATIKLPSRVPYGFHGTFLTSTDLAHQL